MKITLEQLGGLAGIRRRTTLDTAGLGDARAEVEALARALEHQSGASGSPHPDEMAYALSIAADDGTHEFAATDANASPDFARLVQQVKRLGKAETG